MDGLIVHELEGSLFQKLTVGARPIQLSAVRPHLIRYGAPAGTLKLQIQTEAGDLIAESAALPAAGVGSAAAYWHGYQRFLIDSHLKENTTYRLAIVGASGYAFSEAAYIGWVNDDSYRKVQPTYYPNRGGSAPLDFELWEIRRERGMRVLDVADGYDIATPPEGSFTEATSLAQYASDAAYVAAKGAAAAAGDSYFNTTYQTIRVYRSGAWVNADAPVITGSRAAPVSITAVGGITPAVCQSEIQYVKGSGGPVTVSANPQIAAGTFVGQRLELRGRSDADYVALANGNGLELHGDIQLVAGSSLGLGWDGTVWSEEYRNDL